MSGRKTRWIRLLSILCLAVCGVSGCGKEEAREAEEKESSRQPAESTGFDLAAGSWKRGEEIWDSEENWAVADYWGDYMMEIPCADLSLTGSYSMTDGARYYLLERYTAMGNTGEGCQKYYMTRVDMAAMEAERDELVLQGAAEGSGEALSEPVEELMRDLDENWAIITGADLWEGKLCLMVQQQDRESKAPGHCFIVWLNREGKVERMTDILPELEQAGMVQDKVLPGGIMYDRQEFCYVGVSGGSGGVGVFDREGELVKRLEAPNDSRNPVYATCRLPDGRPVFECADTDWEKSTVFCLEGLEQKVLYYGESDNSKVRYLSGEGTIYYVDDKGLVRWNPETGSRELICEDMGVNPWSYEAIWEIPGQSLEGEETGGEIAVVFFDDKETFLQKLSPGARTEETVVTFYMTGTDQILERFAAEYSRKNPGAKIKIQKPDSSYDGDFSRLAMELVKDQGPDLFLLRREELEILQDKGVLAEMREVLPEEIREQIFPSVLRYGMVGEKLYGIGNRCGASTIAVPDSVWQKDTWDWPDIVSLMEDSKASGDGYQAMLGALTPGKLLGELVIRSIDTGQSSLVDQEAGKCYFDTEEFIRMLELCKEYGMNPDLEIDSEESLGCTVSGSLQNFSEAMAELGEGYRCVGYPTKGQFGGAVSCSYLLGMNAGTEHREIAEDFLRYVFSDKKQREVGWQTVRKDILCNYVKEHSEFSNKPVYWFGAYTYTELAGRPDGSSYLPEYLEILEKGMVGPDRVGKIGIIILEEAEAYFNGDKSAAETAEIIQSRVGLYLEE